jgi:hypothetical protein
MTKMQLIKCLLLLIMGVLSFAATGKAGCSERLPPDPCALCCFKGDKDVDQGESTQGRHFRTVAVVIVAFAAAVAAAVAAAHSDQTEWVTARSGGRFALLGSKAGCSALS